MLDLNPSVHRFLISSPCRIVGDYKMDNFKIDHVWQMSEHSLELATEGAFSSNYFVLSLYSERPPFNGGLILLPHIDPSPLLVYLSVLFGKRFEYHGEIQSYGGFRLPSIPSIKPTPHYKSGFNNNKKRSNYCPITRQN